MLSKCEFIGREIRLKPPTLSTEKNIFTVVVGKNGSGKSQLLQGIVQATVDSSSYMLHGLAHTTSTRFLEKDYDPSVVIASSTSPFDKFPTTRSRQLSGDYEYLGLKGLPSTNLSLGFLNKTISGLVRSIYKSEANSDVITRVLEYLNYESVLRFRFELIFSRATLDRILESESPAEAILYEIDQSGVLSRAVARTKLSNYTLEEIYRVLEALQLIRRRGRNIRLSLERGMIFDDDYAQLDPRLLELLEAGLLTTKVVELKKVGVKKLITLREASSGEQCVLMSLLGIATYIRDGALVLIDEPEICLHPEWQEKYISLLTELFSEYEGCHFVIATHSPQIVSRLGTENCYILDLQSGELTDAAEANHRSADYQLASIFRAPGYKNEYLSREIISALESISRGNFPSERNRVQLIRISELKGSLELSDPVYKLVTLLDEVLKEI